MTPYLIDLHLHLDGSLSPASVRDLARLQRIVLPESPSALEDLLAVRPGCRSLNEFLTRFAFPLSLLQTPDALETATVNLLAELHDEGLLYAEIRFAPQLHTRTGMTQEDAVSAVAAGVKAAQDLLPCGVILCAYRGETPESNRETLRLAEKYLGAGVNGLDLAGAEALYPTQDYLDLLRAAVAAGIPLTVHAGEAAGPESIRTALRAGARRIGHGVRAIEDPDLLRELADRDVTLEMCPTSNLCTGLLRDLSGYPLKTFAAAGIPVTVNTDDRTVCRTDLPRELRLLTESGVIRNRDILPLQRTAARAAFAGDDLRKHLLEKLDAAEAALS